MSGLRGKVAIIGVGLTKFGEHFDLGIKELLCEAFLKAVESANIDPKEIQAAWYATYAYKEGYPASLVADWLGLRHKPVTHVENACASGSEALRNAAFAIAANVYDIVLAIGAEKMRDLPSDEMTWYLPRDYVWEQSLWMTGPANFAIYATRYMHEYGMTKEDMALVAVKNHRNGAKNPYAHFQREIKVEDVLNSPIVAWPFNLYDCCPQTDGAAAAILCKAEIARKYTDTPVFIEGCGIGHDRVMIAHKKTLTSFAATVAAAREAYEMAGVKPEDIDVAEVHDCFTATEIITYDDLGFCRRGEGPKLIREGMTEIDGKIPVNPRGGLKAMGHPIGATGIAMACEIFWQLRGEAGKRQVPGSPTIGLTHQIAGQTNVASVMIFRRK